MPNTTQKENTITITQDGRYVSTYQSKTQELIDFIQCAVRIGYITKDRARADLSGDSKTFLNAYPNGRLVGEKSSEKKSKYDFLND